MGMGISLKSSNFYKKIQVQRCHESVFFVIDNICLYLKMKMMFCSRASIHKQNHSLYHNCYMLSSVISYFKTGDIFIYMVNQLCSVYLSNISLVSLCRWTFDRITFVYNLFLNWTHITFQRIMLLYRLFLLAIDNFVIGSSVTFFGFSKQILEMLFPLLYSFFLACSF